MKKTKFAFSNAVTADDIKCIRKKLSLTQASFAQLVNVSTKTVERWEAESKPITGPIVSLVKILNEYSQIAKEYEEAIRTTGPDFECDYPEYDVVAAFHILLIKKNPLATVEEARSIAYAFRTISRHHLRLYKGVKECLADIIAEVDIYLSPF